MQTMIAAKGEGTRRLCKYLLAVLGIGLDGVVPQIAQADLRVRIQLLVILRQNALKRFLRRAPLLLVQRQRGERQPVQPATVCQSESESTMDVRGREMKRMHTALK